MEKTSISDAMEDSLTIRNKGKPTKTIGQIIKIDLSGLSLEVIHCLINVGSPK